MTIAAHSRRPASTATPKETLLLASQRMEKEGIGFLVVTDGEDLAGVLTDRDIALQVGAEGRDAATTHVADVMNESPLTVRGDLALDEAFGLMRGKRVRRLPVVDHRDRVTGVVSTDDLVLLLSREIGALGEVVTAQLPPESASAAAASGPPRREVEHYVGEVVTVAASTPVDALMREMRDHAVGSVVVLDAAGRAVGLVTDRDVALRVVAAGRTPSRTPSSAVMSTPLTAAKPTDPVESVVESMRRTGVRRIPILEDGRPVGIVAFDDLLVAFGSELEQLGACVAGEIRSSRARSQGARLRGELEARIEEAAAQLRRLGDQSLRRMSSEFEQVAERVVHSIRRASGSREEHREIEVRDLMEPDVRSCRPQDALSEPARIMWERDCGCVPVVASDGSNRVVGMITDRDICMATYTSGRLLAELRVSDSMSRGVHSVGPDDPVAEAERVMRDARVRRLPVMDERGHLLGILSLADVAEAAAGRRIPEEAVSRSEVARTLEAICRPRSEVARADG
jgi:CBS domain-containing protein